MKQDIFCRGRSCITRLFILEIACPKSDLLQPSGEADACHGKSGFLYRTADADSPGDGKVKLSQILKTGWLL